MENDDSSLSIDLHVSGLHHSSVQGLLNHDDLHRPLISHVEDDDQLPSMVAHHPLLHSNIDLGDNPHYFDSKLNGMKKDMNGDGIDINMDTIHMLSDVPYSPLKENINQHEELIRNEPQSPSAVVDTNSFIQDSHTPPIQLHPEVLTGLGELKMLIPIPLMSNTNMLPPTSTHQAPPKRLAEVPVESQSLEKVSDDEPKRIHSSETTVIDGVVYNSRGYEVCGHLNQHNKPCQRIGYCPFHGSKTKIPSPPMEVAPSMTVTTNPAEDLRRAQTRPSIKKAPYKQGWTKEEHRRFLDGLQKFGKGSWKEIAGIVRTRTPTQIQSHAQKYYLRQKQEKKNKKSIHDLTLDDLQEVHHKNQGQHIPIVPPDVSPLEVPRNAQKVPVTVVMNTNAEHDDIANMPKAIQVPQYANIIQYPQPTAIQAFPSFAFGEPQIIYGTYVKSADGQTVPVSFNPGFAFPAINSGGFATINTYPGWYPAPYYNGFHPHIVTTDDGREQYFAEAEEEEQSEEDQEEGEEEEPQYYPVLNDPNKQYEEEEESPQLEQQHHVYVNHQ